jgi:hypothetical protein
MIEKLMLFPNFKNYRNNENLTLEELRDKSIYYEQNDNLQEAIRNAKIAAINYGIEGIMLYLPLQYRHIYNLYINNELIQQESQKTLALIIFTETEIGKKQYPRSMLNDLEQLKTSLLQITQDKNFILSEAKQIASQMSEAHLIWAT